MNFLTRWFIFQRNGFWKLIGSQRYFCKLKPVSSLLEDCCKNCSILEAMQCNIGWLGRTYWFMKSDLNLHSYIISWLTTYYNIPNDVAHRNNKNCDIDYYVNIFYQNLFAWYCHSVILSKSKLLRQDVLDDLIVWNLIYFRYKFWYKKWFSI